MPLRRTLVARAADGGGQGVMGGQAVMGGQGARLGERIRSGEPAG
ncbi:hypothetical protein [Sinorhizobium meliloti]|nr:hypothetical protein [Sinorhizobium meliloti]